MPALLPDLERDFFGEGPWQDHPMPLSPVPEPLYPTMTDRPEVIEPVEAADQAEPPKATGPEPAEPAAPETLSGPLREVHVDSHRPGVLTHLGFEPETEAAP